MFPSPTETNICPGKMFVTYGDTTHSLFGFVG